MEAGAPAALGALEIVRSKEFTIDNDLDTLFVIWATSMVLFMQVRLFIHITSAAIFLHCYGLNSCHLAYEIAPVDALLAFDTAVGLLKTI